MSAFEVLALNTSIPQIQAAQAGDSYVMVVNATTPALRITQTGTGDSILVEDAANPDSSPFVVTAAGDVGIGTSSPGYKLTVNAFTGVSGPIGAFKQSAETSAFYGVAVQRSGNDSTLGMAFNSSADAWQISASYASSGAYKPIQLLTSDTVRATLDSSGNLGLGVTPTTGGYGKSFQFTDDSVGTLMTLQSQAINTNDRRLSLTNNAKSSGVGTWAYFNTSSSATMYQQGTGEHRWFTAAPAAGPAISFTQAMTLDASGRLLVGATSASTGARATLTSAAQASGAACADSGILLYSTANLATGEYAPFITWSGNFSNPNRARAAIGAVSSSTSTALDLVFLTRSAADASEIGTGSERARITSGGNLLVGTNDASQGSGNGNKLAAGGAVWVVNAATADGFSYYNSSAAAYRFYVSSAGTISATNTTISAISDQRLKENIQDLDVGLDKILALKPRKFDWKAGKGKNIKGDRGWIAQEFEQVFPDMIDEWKDPAPEGEEPYKSVRADLIPVLVKAIQELKAEVDSLKAQLEAK